MVHVERGIAFRADTGMGETYPKSQVTFPTLAMLHSQTIASVVLYPWVRRNTPSARGLQGRAQISLRAILA